MITACSSEKPRTTEYLNADSIVNEEIFYREMEKGVQGTLSLDEYDSILLIIHLENRDVSEEHIKNWHLLSDSEKIDALMYDYLLKDLK